MPDTLPIVKLTKAWQDLYAVTGIPKSSSVSVQSINASDVEISISPDAPTGDPLPYEILTKGQKKTVPQGSSCLWGRSESAGAVSVQLETFEPITPKSAFGETLVAEKTPVVRMAANYGIIDKAFVLTTGGATAVAEDSLFKAKTAAATLNTSAILSKHQITYRPGEGASSPFTAKFTEGVAGSEQIAGFIAGTDGFGFGYDGDSFGVLHAHDGKVEIQELTITTPAGGSEDATITINGVGYTVPITAGTAVHNAIEIAASLNAQVASYSFTSNNNQVIAASLFSGPQSAFAFSSSTAIAAWVQIVGGVTTINDWAPVAAWNQYVPPSLNPQKGNVYEVKFQYLGFGGIEFSVENPETADFDLVHRIKYANSHDLPSVTNPTFRLGWAATNITNDTEIEVSGTSIAGFIEGKVVLTEDPISIPASIVALSQVTTSLLVLRNREVLNLQRNRAEIFPIKVSAFAESVKGSILQVIKFQDVPGGGELDFQYFDKDKSITEFSLDQIPITGGVIVDALPVSPSGNTLDLAQLDLHLLPGEYLAIAMVQNGTPALPANIIITLREDL